MQSALAFHIYYTDETLRRFCAGSSTTTVQIACYVPNGDLNEQGRSAPHTVLTLLFLADEENLHDGLLTWATWSH